MPAPYPLIEMPPGQFSNQFDFQAMNMAGAHNSFIQGVNAAVAHAPHITKEKVQPFMIFCLTLVAVIHHHHMQEETFYFVEMEKKLGAGALSGNVEEHADFVPQIEEMEKWLKDVQSGKEQYDAKVLVEKMYSFSDTMVEHLNHEIATLESSRVAAVFTEEELRAIEKEFMKRALSTVDFYTDLPFMTVCANPATPWFPPLPIAVKLATRFWFSRRHSDAWVFGATDFSGKARVLPGPPA